MCNVIPGYFGKFKCSLLTPIIIKRQSTLDMHELNSLRAIVARKFYGLLLPNHKLMYIANLNNSVCDCI